MHDMITQGKALYWGTSEWSADEIRAAYAVADKHHLHKPLMEQPQYNLFHRDKIETEFARLYEDIGLGTTIFSPLSNGVLTGKYLDGVPEGSRADVKNFGWLDEAVASEEVSNKVRNLVPIAKELDCSMAQLALAWCAANPNVSSVITGASRASQVTENMAAIDVVQLLTSEVLDRIEHAVS